jgi:hypothetical protein
MQIDVNVGILYRWTNLTKYTRYNLYNRCVSVHFTIAFATPNNNAAKSKKFDKAKKQAQNVHEQDFDEPFFRWKLKNVASTNFIGIFYW